MSYSHTEAIDTLLKNNHVGNNKKQLKNFLKTYYSLASDEDLMGYTPESLLAIAKQHFDLLSTFSGKTALNLYNPTKAEHGYDSEYSVLDIVTVDRPFLIDSIQMAFVRQNLAIHFVTHPIYHCQFDDKGQLKLLQPATVSKTENLSVIHIAFDKLPAGELKKVKKAIQMVLKQIEMATDDWQAMSDKIDFAIKEIETTRALPQTVEEIMETIQFLAWLKRKHFTFLGYRQYQLNKNALHVVADSGLGVLRDDGAGNISKSFADLPERLKTKSLKPNLLLFSKSDHLSTIHRPVYMDFIGVKQFDDKGQVVGEHRFLGLLTTEAYRLLPSEIPLLSHKVNEINRLSELPENSHALRSFDNILAQLPRDELFQANAEHIRHMALSIFHLRERDQLRFFARKDTFETYVACYIYVPKERYNTKLRRRMENYLVKKLGGYDSEFSTHFSESLHVRVEILVRTKPGKINDFDIKAIESELTPMMLDWNDETLRLLKQKVGKRSANSLFKHYEKIIPITYKDNFSPTNAVEDIAILQSLNEQQPLGVDLFAVSEENPADSVTKLRLKLYGLGEIASLSALLPVLENFGFTVKSATPYQFEEKGKNVYWLVNFKLQLSQPLTKPLTVLAPQFTQAFINTWTGVDESDGFDQLVISHAISPRDVTFLRAVAKYILQAKAPYSKEYMQQALNQNAEIATQLIALFHTKMGLKVSSRKKQTQALIESINQSLSAVSSLDEDRILRWFIHVIGAMVRTNFFQKDAEGNDKSYVSFKLESAKIPELPLPKPLYEIFVYSTDMEAIHLRGGKVARGGLRWSDRIEDYRTEVLGLVKAQIVKNAVIVPMGSKGGFIVKKPDHSSREAYMNEGIRCYKIFMRGLLDITDNIIGGKIVAPKEVYRHDEDDPYLVVAADKGTASFSDIANSMSAEYQFWLGDAFASGGSVGYDHKGMGITARGAWESVKRHFRHLGTNIQEQVFTVVGIGDMSGDVFGNGMLLSDKIQLTAAFNHLHIFIDPAPNAAKTFTERQRLFKLPRSSWDDFDQQLISDGGGVFSRQDKSIKITPQMQQVFAIKEQELSPDQLIKCLLKAPVDLLWNGGIGTYVKAAGETHAMVGDKANDSLRINGDELRCRVVGEGGNLGFTQLGRIEYAQKGGIILTDAIDNSAGVNCSDHEVNIKILLNQLVEQGELTLPARNKLLESMTDEVARLVLRQNYQQPQSLIIEAENKALFTDHKRIIKQMEKQGRLSRELEGLPDDKTLQAREKAGQGFYTPELAILLAYSKIQLFEELIASDLPDEPVFQEDLSLYFPTPLRKKYSKAMTEHRLRREIIATFVTNSTLNHMGPVFIHRTKEATGQSSEQIIMAYCAARNIFKARHYWNSVDALDNQVPADLQNQLHLRIRHTLEQAANWFLSHRRGQIHITELQQAFEKLSEVAEYLPNVLAEETITASEAEKASLVAEGVPEVLAHDLTYLPHLVSGLDIIELTAKCKKYGLDEMTQLHFGLANRLNARWLVKGVNQLNNNDYWRRRACHSLLDSLYGHLVSITEQTALLDSKPTVAMQKWQEKHAEQISGYQRCLDEITQGAVDFSRLSVVIGELAALARSE